MQIGNYVLTVVCANYDKKVGGYGDIYNSVETCLEEHPNDEVIFGYYLEGGEDIGWFDSVEDAVSWANEMEDEIGEEL